MKWSSGESAPRGQVSPAGEAISVIGGRPGRPTPDAAAAPAAPRALPTSNYRRTVHSCANDVEFLSSTRDHMPFVLAPEIAATFDRRTSFGSHLSRGRPHSHHSPSQTRFLPITKYFQINVMLCQNVR